jgi:CO/xanthine dehydrogenase FAD-binding subunit
MASCEVPAWPLGEFRHSDPARGGKDATIDQPWGSVTGDGRSEAGRGEVQPIEDIHVSSEYRRHLVGALIRRAFRRERP